MVQFFRNCIKHRVIFISLFFATLILFYFVAISNHTDDYMSQTTILVSIQINESNELTTYEVLQAFQVSEKLVYDIPGIIMSTKVLNDINQVIAGFSSESKPYTMNEFKSQVTTNILTNTRVVEINVINNNPAIAQLIARTVAESTQQMVTDLYKQEYIVIVKDAEYPSQPNGLTLKLLWVIGLLGSLIMGFLAIVVLTIVENNNVEKNTNSEA